MLVYLVVFACLGLLILLGKCQVLLGYGRKGLAARTELGKDNKKLGYLFNLINVLWFGALIIVSVLDALEGYFAWSLIAIYLLGNIAWILWARKQVPKLQEEVRSLEKKREVEETERKEEIRKAREAMKADQERYKSQSPAQQNDIKNMASSGALQDVLSYALRYSTEDGMRRYITSMASRAENAEVKDKLNDILTVPDSDLRAAIEQALNT